MRFGTTALLVLALALSSRSARADSCNAPTANFRDAVVKPGERSARLAAKLAAVGDYGNHAGGWLAARLFALDDDVQIAGTIAKKPACFAHESDDDLSFMVVLTPMSKRNLARYFDSANKVPATIEVKLVASLRSLRKGAPFRTWRAGSAALIDFATGQEKPRAITYPQDWQLIQAPEWRFVIVRGALVVDYAGRKPGSGHLEIHPAESVRLLRTLPEHH